MSSLGPDLRPTRIIGKNVGYSFLEWVVIYLCVCFGVKTTGRITYFTMGFPIVLLFVFLGRSVTLEGAQAGIDEYLNSNWEVLTERPEVWSRAVSQIFFSIGITFGIMTAYGSYCKKGEPVFVNSCVVAISNCLFSFIAGFAGEYRCSRCLLRLVHSNRLTVKRNVRSICNAGVSGNHRGS